MPQLRRSLAVAACATLLGFGVICASTSTAWAQSSIAEALYQEGRQLMEAGRYSEACPKFEESQKLEPGMGTLLNLATCNEKLGKSATAWSQFSEAYSILTKETDEQRAAYAKERRDTLAGTLSRITIQVPQTSRVAGIVISLDGVAVGSAAWGLAVPVDPGAHTIKAEAPGYQPWEGRFEIAARGNNSVTVPALHKLANAQPPPQQQPQPGPTPQQPPGAEPGRPLGAAVIIAGVATLALTGAAVGTGVVYMKRQKNYNTLNDDPTASSGDVERSHTDANKMGNLNLIFTGAAAAGAITTGILFFTRPKAESATAITPWVSPMGAGATVLQRF
jgi:hypothetical protein